MSTKQTRMYARIQKHGEQLNAIFKTDHDPIELCKKLRRIEAKQDRANTDYCNGTLTTEEHDALTDKTRAAVVKLLGDQPPLYVNCDPRGYALKINDGIMRERGYQLYRDFGGYGILAPDLTND